MRRSFDSAARSPYALRVLGSYYARGDIVQQSLVKARELVKGAADLGYRGTGASGCNVSHLSRRRGR